jgi:hypothetical protein
LAWYLPVLIHCFFIEGMEKEVSIPGKTIYRKLIPKV